jgi:hypothetical protein
VRGRDRHSLEYVEGVRTAIVDVEFGVRTVCIFGARLRDWTIGGKLIPMTADERRILERVSSAERYQGLTVEISGSLS